MTKTKNSEPGSQPPGEEGPTWRRTLQIAKAIDAEGGRALIVGGWVRDRLLGREARDIDVEIYGLDGLDVETLLADFAPVVHVGRSFSVMRIKGLDVDFSLPVLDGYAPRMPGAEPQAHGEPDLEFEAASRRRDLTMNSMAWDPLREELFDPHGGREDLERDVMRATHARRFNDDPLRALRVARFVAQLGLEPDPELVQLCASQDLRSVAPERVFDELRRLLLSADRPSRGLAFLESCGLLKFLPELEALVGVPQDPVWHPEGDVWGHTLMVVDEAAALRSGEANDDLALMLGAVCHDFGKPLTTQTVEEGRIRSLGHDRAGLPPTRSFLERLRVPNALAVRVLALVEHHLAPAQFASGGAKAPAYRRLLRKLSAADVSVELLERVARADHLGRTTEDALARDCAPIEHFMSALEEADRDHLSARDVVAGRHVISRGVSPGPEVGRILEHCRRIQDETGSRDPEEILNQVLSPGSK